MVRINIIPQIKLTDQHLLAENLEIIMLINSVRKNPCLKDIPSKYCLGKGHIKFFKNKLLYLKNRHELIKKEMRKRGFKAKAKISLAGFKKAHLKNWKPTSTDLKIIKKRIRWKIKNKPNFYRYYGNKIN